MLNTSRIKILGLGPEARSLLIALVKLANLSCATGQYTKREDYHLNFKGLSIGEAVEISGLSSLEGLAGLLDLTSRPHFFVITEPDHTATVDYDRLFCAIQGEYRHQQRRYKRKLAYDAAFRKGEAIRVDYEARLIPDGKGSYEGVSIDNY